MRLSLVEIEEVRRQTRNDLWTAVVLLGIRLGMVSILGYFPKGQYLSTGTAILVVTFVGELISASVLYMLRETINDFFQAWSDFYERRYLPKLREFEKRGYKVPWSVSKWRFMRVSDLEEFEKTLMDGLLAARNVIDQQRKIERWRRMSEKLYEQLEILLTDFGVDESGWNLIVGDFNSIENPRRKREFLNGLSSRLAHERWKSIKPTSVSTLSHGVQESLVPEDIELRSLEARSTSVVDPEALKLVQLASIASLRREKIRYLGQALLLDQKAEEKKVEVAVRGEILTPAASAEVKRLSLREFSRTRLECMREIIGDADWKMCREIVLVLLEPGRTGARFNKRYFAEDTVAVEVRRRYQVNVGEQFDPTSFSKSVKALLSYGVLVTKPKTDERTLSLSTRVKGAKTPQAAEIIAAALRLKREATGFV